MLCYLMTETIQNLTKKVVFLEEENAYLKAQLYGRKKETVVFDNFNTIRNFGTYIRPAYQLTVTPTFVAQ